MNRRAAMKLAGAAALGAHLSRAAEPAVSSVTIRLSAYMAGAAARELPADVLEKTKHHILDTFAAMISGAGLAPAPRRGRPEPSADFAAAAGVNGKSGVHHGKDP